jgi:hypothetical protein
MGAAAVTDIVEHVVAEARRAAQVFAGMESPEAPLARAGVVPTPLSRWAA